MSDIDTDVIREQHQSRPDCCTIHADTDRRYCAMDGQWWPCDAIALADALDAARARCARQHEAILIAESKRYKAEAERDEARDAVSTMVQMLRDAPGVAP